ncbi:MAG: phosphoribosylformylglycinamidine synthase subunit PurQ [Microbacteriaceae bacterium]|jgi:phosphoribosylformylglycinamidine synthase|nr:phosphoribosylformylglycinamidine synthase subunit PurQ [Microbacteriaceae bacterium]
MTRIGVVTFPGSLDDGDARRAVAAAGAEPVRLWHQDVSLGDVDAVILPGGFSYGDYLRAGAIASFSPIMGAVRTAAAAGMPVLGICNGFQMLTETHLLPGALVRNAGQRFLRTDQRLRVECTATPWTGRYTAGQEITVPIKHADGRYVADARTLAELEDTGRIVVRYVGTNPNGSDNDIAGVCNEAGNVVGMMPHPEHASLAGFGPDSEQGLRAGTDGLAVFTSVLASLADSEGARA